jgi:hypothetical protein
MAADIIKEGQESPVTPGLPVYFIAFQIKDFYRKSYTQDLLKEYSYKFEQAVQHWTLFVQKYRNNKLTIPNIKPADLFEFAEEFSKSDAIAIACLCFLYDHVAKEGFLIE